MIGVLCALHARLHALCLLTSLSCYRRKRCLFIVCLPTNNQLAEMQQWEQPAGTVD
jgi:hypothetical protein